MKRRIIFAVLIVVCALAIYLYAHHNWNSLPVGTTIDRILVEKSARRLSIFQKANQIKSYRIALGRNPLGAKQEEGDMKTPEGIYKIDGRNPQSSFHLALHISYPSDEDDKRAAARGVPPGFDIMSVVIIKDACITLPCATVMHHNELPATPLHRCTADRIDHRTC